MNTNSRSSSSTKAVARTRKAANARQQTHASRRTTITLSPESQQIVERFKSASGTSTSAAIDRIIQRSEPKPSRLKQSDIGLLVLDVPFRRVNVTLEDVKRAEDEMDREYVEQFLRPSKRRGIQRSRNGSQK
jgi:hypothetical protein